MQTHRFSYDKHAAKIRRHWLLKRPATKADKARNILSQHLPSKAGEISLTELLYSRRYASSRARIAKKVRVTP